MKKRRIGLRLRLKLWWLRKTLPEGRYVLQSPMGTYLGSCHTTGGALYETNPEHPYVDVFSKAGALREIEVLYSSNLTPVAAPLTRP